MQEKIQKIIANSGLMSRRSAEDCISSGRVTVNRITAVLGDRADSSNDVIEVDGFPLKKTGEKLYVMLNKPAGYVTTMHDEQGRKNVSELVSSIDARLYPVGRLDIGSEGLLLMTNDGDFANSMMHPSHSVKKTYRVILRDDGQADLSSAEDRISMMKEPIEIDGRLTTPAEVRILRKAGDRVLADVSIFEGRNRQIRRLCERSGFRVLRLTRISEGSLKLGNLRSGEYRFLTEEEIKRLKHECEL